MTTLDPKELLDKFRNDHAGLVAALEAALPKPTHPEHMFDLWAKHPELGEVVCIWDKPGSAGGVLVRWRDESDKVGSRGDIVHVSELTFPHQATKPEDVPAGEAWLVNVNDGHYLHTRVVALKDEPDDWRTSVDKTPSGIVWSDNEVTLIAPLVPARPEPQPEHPRTLSSVEDYENAPEGTIVASPDNSPWVKTFEKGWGPSWSVIGRSNSDMSILKEQYVLRWGRGNE